MSLTNGTQYELSDSEYQAVLKVRGTSAKHIVIQEDLVMINAIVAIQSEERGQEAVHRRNGDYQCNHGIWHNRGDRCYGHDGSEIAGHMREHKRLYALDDYKVLE